MDTDTLLNAALLIAIGTHGDPDKASDGIHWLASKVDEFQSGTNDAKED